MGGLYLCRQCIIIIQVYINEGMVDQQTRHGLESNLYMRLIDPSGAKNECRVGVRL